MRQYFMFELFRRRAGLAMSMRAPIFALLAVAVFGHALLSAAQKPVPNPQTKKPAAAAPAAPAAPQSTHYPILLLASGPATDAEPAWSIRIGQKGPERLDRPGYPPAMLDPVDVAREGTSDAWTYRAKDSATGADLTVHLSREPCSADATGAKYTFRAVAEHTQIGTLTGCARIAAELFPRINNQPDPDADDDADKKPPVLPTDIIKFQSPNDVAYIIATGKVAVAIGKIRKIAAAEGSELALSHDGKKLLFTRSDSKTGPDRTIVLYDTTSGHSQDLVHGSVRQAFWSPDDSRVAFLNFQDQKWQLWTFPAASPTQASPLYPNSLTSLHGWTDAHTLLASDMQNAYWISDDGRVAQTIALREVYGDVFDVAGSDTFRVNPINPDLLLVSAPYLKAPAGSPTDSMGLAAGFFLYEVRSKRRVVLSPTDQWTRHAEWSRDGVQVFYTKRVSAASLLTYRMLWDGSTPRRYLEGSDLVIGR
jgi:uncharacterized membrane protein